jgi:transcriptional regulator with XRE-family HTH domain
MSIHAAYLIRSETCRAARGLLNWTRAHLAKESGVSEGTIKTFEYGKKNTTTLDTKVAITDAFSRAGVEFTNGDEPGVKLRASHATASNGEGNGPAQGKGRPGRRGGSSTAEAQVAA